MIKNKVNQFSIFQYLSSEFNSHNRIGIEYLSRNIDYYIFSTERIKNDKVELYMKLPRTQSIICSWRHTDPTKYNELVS